VVSDLYCRRPLPSVIGVSWGFGRFGCCEAFGLDFEPGSGTPTCKDLSDVEHPEKEDLDGEADRPGEECR